MIYGFLNNFKNSATRTMHRGLFNFFIRTHESDVNRFVLCCLFSLAFKVRVIDYATHRIHPFNKPKPFFGGSIIYVLLIRQTMSRRDFRHGGWEKEKRRMVSCKTVCVRTGVTWPGSFLFSGRLLKGKLLKSSLSGWITVDNIWWKSLSLRGWGGGEEQSIDDE